MRVNVVAWDSGGLATDIDVLTAVLERAGCTVTFKGRQHRRPRNRLHSLLMTANVLVAQHWASLTHRPQFEVNFFVESVFPEFLAMARTNCLFVNQEWFRDSNLPHLSRLSILLCKTPSGVRCLQDLPVACCMVGFTSPDKRIIGFKRCGPIRCLHLSGQSAVKGTEAVVEAWSRNPGWPQLTVVRRTKRYDGGPAAPLPPLPNVCYETDYLPDDRLRELQNACEIHVLPSQAEAYGHVIGEAMSCGAVVVTTDAPPMNELVQSDRGVLIRVARSEPLHRSTRYFVDIADLEMKLDQVFSMPPAERRQLGQNARVWYEAQHRRFEASLHALLEMLTCDGAPKS